MAEEYLTQNVNKSLFGFHFNPSNLTFLVAQQYMRTSFAYFLVEKSGTRYCPIFISVYFKKVPLVACVILISR